MRIGSMDASANIRTLHEPRIGIGELNSGPWRKVNVSQLTEFEKLELPISERVIINAIERANRAISGYNRRFEYSVHEKTNDIIVKVIDNDTNEVIREIPPEKILDLIAGLMEIAGLIVDERR